MNKSKILYTYFFLFTMLFVMLGCEWKLRPGEEETNGGSFEVQRYDRLQSLYLQTGDFSALQQMNTTYPIETRTLIEKVLQLGSVDDPEINHKFLVFYQDTTLQTVISDAETQYANMDDLNQQFNFAFDKLKTFLPDFEVPTVYAQIGALDQSIVVGNNTVGVSLDKYLGEDYQLYKRFYSDQQRQSMTREYIVPDCLVFYLISLYPLNNFESRTQTERDLHMAKMMFVVNSVLQKKILLSPYVLTVEKFMHKHPQTTMEKLLKEDNLVEMSKL